VQIKDVPDRTHAVLRAELLDAILVTSGTQLSTAPGLRCRVEVLT